jgi:hypothetical protein
MWAWWWRRGGTSGTRRRACAVSGALKAWARDSVYVTSLCACGRGCGCAVRFKSPFARGGAPTTAAKASGYLFKVRRHVQTGKWFAQIKLRGVHVHTRQHKHAWQAAADLEWQLARLCAHTGEPRSYYVSNAARLVELGRADAAGVLTEAVEVTPWDLSRWDAPGVSAPGRAIAAPAAPAPTPAPAPAVGAGGPVEAAEEPQPHITVELEHLTRQEQRLVAPWLTDDLLDAMGCRRDDEPPSPEVAAYVVILWAERVVREVEQAVAAAAAAAAAGGGGASGDAAPAEEAPAAVAVVADAGAGAGGAGGGWGGAIGLAIADAAAAEASGGGVWQDAWDGVWDGPAVAVPPEPSPVPAATAPAAAVGSKRRRGSGAASSEAAAARAGAGGRRRVEEDGGGGGGW